MTGAYDHHFEVVDFHANVYSDGICDFDTYNARTRPNCVEVALGIAKTGTGFNCEQNFKSETNCFFVNSVRLSRSLKENVIIFYDEVQIVVVLQVIVFGVDNFMKIANFHLFHNPVVISGVQKPIKVVLEDQTWPWYMLV